MRPAWELSVSMFTQHKAVDGGGIQANLASQNGAEAGRVQTGAGANHTATVQAGFAPDDLGHCVAGVGNVDNNAIKANGEILGIKTCSYHCFVFVRMNPNLVKKPAANGSPR